MRMKNKWLSIYQLFTLRKFLNYHESTLAEDHACLRQCRWHRHQPEANS